MRRWSWCACVSVCVSVWWMCVGQVGVAHAQQGAVEPAERGGARSPLPEWELLIEELSALGWGDVTMWRIIGALVVMMLGLLMRTYLLKRLLKPFEALASRTTTELDDRLLHEIERPLGWLLNLFGIYLAVLMLRLPEGLNGVVLLLLNTVGIVFVAWMLYNGIEALSMALSVLAQRTESQLDDQMVPLVRKVLRVALIALTVIMIIQQWGYDVTSLVAGLGLGGLAFALAAQSTLANFFGSIMLLTDRPFKVGDWVKSKHGEGVVEEIGLRSTRVRTFSKSLISVPNADIAGTAVENFSEMTLRRIKTDLGLVYATTPEQVEYIVEGIKTLIREDSDMYQGFFLVNFVGFGESSLDILIYCFTNTTSWADWMAIRQRFYLDVMRLVREAGTSVAFPSRSLYIETPVGSYAERAPGVPPEHEVPEEVLRALAAVSQPPPEPQASTLGEVNDGLSSTE